MVTLFPVTPVSSANKTYTAVIKKKIIIIMKVMFSPESLVILKTDL